MFVVYDVGKHMCTKVGKHENDKQHNKHRVWS